MNWLKRDGPREKLLKHGSKALTDQEILAIFLRTGTRKKGVMALSRELIETFGGLRGLLQADQAEILTVNGIGEATYVQLKAALEMTERYIETGLQRGDALSDPIMTRRYLKSKLRNYDREVFACLFLTISTDRFVIESCSLARLMALACIRARSSKVSWLRMLPL